MRVQMSAKHEAPHHCRPAAVHLERARGGDDDGGVGAQPAGAALDIAELLEAYISAEASLRHHETALAHQLQRNLRNSRRVSAAGVHAEAAA